MRAWIAAFLTVVALPAAAQPVLLPPEIAWPEGIAMTPRGDAFYVAGTRDGTIARVSWPDRNVTVIPTGLAAEIGDAFPGVLGLEIDGKGRLWMAGGRSRKIFVVDPKTGARLATIATQDGVEGLINDIAIAGGAAYFTDSRHAMLWRVLLNGALPGKAEPWLPLDGTPINYADGPNLNGIAATPGGRALIVGQMNTGLLFRIDIATRKVTPIDLKGETVTGADGLVIVGRKLYIVRQTVGEIVGLEMAPGFASGTVLWRHSPEGLGWPATAALDGKGLLVVNSQFDKRQSDTAVRPFTVLRWELPD